MPFLSLCPGLALWSLCSSSSQARRYFVAASGLLREHCAGTSGIQLPSASHGPGRARFPALPFVYFRTLKCEGTAVTNFKLGFYLSIYKSLHGRASACQPLLANTHFFWMVDIRPAC